jgi:hypothetical protein
MNTVYIRYYSMELIDCVPVNVHVVHEALFSRVMSCHISFRSTTSVHTVATMTVITTGLCTKYIVVQI